MFLKHAVTAWQAAVCWLALLLPIAGAAQVAVPALRSPVTDLTNTLSSAQIASLEQTLREFESREGSQIAVLLVPTTQPESIEQYSIRVAEQWKLGRAGVDDGVLLLVAKDDRAVRIEVGYGLEGALPDVIANRITDQVIVPRFREGDFDGGIRARRRADRKAWVRRCRCCSCWYSLAAASRGASWAAFWARPRSAVSQASSPGC
jgi:uncharacterized membrane protein YgcG